MAAIVNFVLFLIVPVLSFPLIIKAQSTTAETPVISHAPPGRRPVFLPKPEYPSSAAFIGLEGKVEVSLTVDENGNVSEAAIVSGHPFFHSNSLKAATIAKFEPVLLNGNPVRFRTSIVFDFKRQQKIDRPNLGIVNGRAIQLPKPEVTQELRYLCASGEVGIEVLIDEEGFVAESKPLFGDEFLYYTALKAAKEATFGPVVNGPPVRSRGILVYNFPAEKKCIDVGNVNGKWINRPSFSLPPHPRVSKVTELSVRIGIDPFSGNVLAAKAINGHPSIQRALEKQARGIRFHPSFINTEPFIVKGVISLTQLPNGKVTF